MIFEGTWHPSVRFIGALLPLGFCFLGVAFAQEPAEEAEEPIRVDVNIVSLRFSVRDAASNFVNDLTADDFKVLENGSHRDIAFFEPPRNQKTTSTPLWLSLLIDVSGSTFATRGEEVLAARLFFENINDFTKVGVFGFTDQVIPFQDFTSDRQAALDALAAAHPHLGRTAIYSSLNSIVSSMAKQALPEDRKAVIVISDGMDDNYAMHQASAAFARVNGAVIYTIWVPSAAQLYISSSKTTAAAKAADREAKESAFAQLAEATGGMHFGGFEAILDFDNVLAQINDELFGNLYEIAYYTDQPDLGRRERNIGLEVTTPGYSVQGLFKNLPDRIEAKRDYIAALFDNEGVSELGTSADHFRELGANIDLLRQKQGVEGTNVRFRLRVASYSLQRDPSGGVDSQLGIIGILLDQSGNEVVRLREILKARMSEKDIRDAKGIIYTNRLLAPPGRYLLKVAVLEIPSWRMTVLERSVRVTE
jgi:VWFA-related protein